MKIVSNAVVDKLSREVANLKRELELAQEAYDEFATELAVAACPWEVGDTVIAIRYKARTRHKAVVVQVRPPTYLPAAKDYEVGVKIFKTNGKPSKMIEYIMPGDIHELPE